jgi:FKBP-type peptidyl-prolyl cis-trans isomerase
MKQLRLFFLVTIIAFASCKPNISEEAKNNLAKPEKDIDKVSYLQGYELAAQLEMSDTFRFNIDYFNKGIEDYVKKNKGYFDNDELLAVKKMLMDLRQSHFKNSSEKVRQLTDSISKYNLQVNPEILTKFQKEANVQKTSSGLLYKVLNPGTGAFATDMNTVKINWRGTLIDGSVIENTYMTKRPFEIPVNALFPGLKEACKLMQIGGKYKFMLPPDLAFGEKGMGNQIPPNSIFIIEAEMLEIK